MLLLHCVKIDARRNVEMATLYFFSSCRMSNVPPKLEPKNKYTYFIF